MTGGRFRVFSGFVKRGRETQAGTGQALKDAFEGAAIDPFNSPMETEADAAMRRCIEQLDQLGDTLNGRIKDDGV